MDRRAAVKHGAEPDEADTAVCSLEQKCRLVKRALLVPGFGARLQVEKIMARKNVRRLHGIVGAHRIARSLERGERVLTAARSVVVAVGCYVESLVDRLLRQGACQPHTAQVERAVVEMGPADIVQDPRAGIAVEAVHVDDLDAAVGPQRDVEVAARAVQNGHVVGAPALDHRPRARGIEPVLRVGRDPAIMAFGHRRGAQVEAQRAFPGAARNRAPGWDPWHRPPRSARRARRSRGR
jgi:hypothetical protein